MLPTHFSSRVVSCQSIRKENDDFETRTDCGTSELRGCARYRAQGCALTPFIPLGTQTRDLSGSRFGALLVLGPVKVARTMRPNGRWTVRTYWLCQCDCGQQSTVTGTHLRTGHTLSCGCRQERLKRKGFNRSHGLREAPEYKVWADMRQRCRNPRNKRYAQYGGRGITVCTQWETSFTAFLADVGPRPSLQHTLDRIDPNGNYEPGNCRWATASEQANNRQSTQFYEAFGRRRTCAQWAAEMNIPYKTLHQRLAAGTPIETALMVADLRSARRVRRRPTSSPASA